LVTPASELSAVSSLSESFAKSVSRVFKVSLKLVKARKDRILGLPNLELGLDRCEVCQC
jgi:hypothetical protein